MKLLRRFMGKCCHLFHINVSKIFAPQGRVLMLHWVGDEIQDETKEPGAAVLTNGNDLSSYMVQARLNREQTRSKNKETLLNVINNEAVSKSEKKKAVKSMVKITETNEMENTIESLLKAKGFNDVIVTVSDKQVDVVVSDKEIADNKRAQIEDVIKRKTGLEASAITITPAK